MNRKLLALFCAISMLGTAATVRAQAPPGAQALYCFGNNGTNDLSGNGRHGILAGDASIAGGVLQLNGGGHLELPGVCAFVNGGGAYTLYLKNLKTTEDGQPLFSVGQGLSANVDDPADQRKVYTVFPTGGSSLACKIHSGLVGRKFWRKISRERWFECW